MRRILFLLWLALAPVVLASCGGRKGGAAVSGAGQVPGTFADDKLIMTPETGLSGRVVRINPGGRFVVLNFPIGHLPALDQHLSVYRLGLKTGEVRVTGPQLDDNVVADIVAGDVQIGDQVRDK